MKNRLLGWSCELVFELILLVLIEVCLSIVNLLRIEELNEVKVDAVAECLLHQRFISVRAFVKDLVREELTRERLLCQLEQSDKTDCLASLVGGVEY